MLDYTNRYSTFRKGSSSGNQWNNLQDPTYLSFTLSFVMTEFVDDKGVGHCPLFNGKTVDYLRDF